MKVHLEALLLLPLLVVGQRIPSRIAEQRKASSHVHVAWTGTTSELPTGSRALRKADKKKTKSRKKSMRHYSSSLRRGKGKGDGGGGGGGGGGDPPVSDSADEDSPPNKPDDPFGLKGDDNNGGGASITPPQLPWMGPGDNNDEGDDSEEDAGGVFFMQPDILNNTLAFVSEGDLFVTHLPSLSSEADDHGNTSSSSSPPPAAMKLTFSAGNIRTPKLHPTLPLVAFTATYTGTREVYLQDWRPGKRRRVSTTRLTYWDHPWGVSRIVGWKDETTLVIAAYPTESVLQDFRLFLLNLAEEDLESATTTPENPGAMEITPVPLAQAREGDYYTFDDEGEDGNVECVYFTRIRQGSYTIRYIGGTAENLWMYCTGQELALPLTADYNGTSTNPTIRHIPNDRGGMDPYLFFLSDRSATQTASREWTPTTMNLWAMPLPTETDVYVDNNLAVPVPLTAVSCQMNGRSLQEYAIDSVTGDVMLRVGADFYRLTSKEIQNALSSSSPSSATPRKVHIQLFSDFQETQERLMKVNLMLHLTYLDAFETPVISQGETASAHALLTLRGQSFVIPLLADTTPTVNIPYQGSGQNIPQRRYRIAPGTMTVGVMRVVASIALPVLGEIEGDDDGTSKQWAILLATDPLSATAEHAFYLTRMDPGAPNAFADLTNLPEPFLGGAGGGGSTADGGLGTVRSDSISISPCGRRMAWADTDGRICVMTIPLYQSKPANTSQQYNYTVLPKKNELGEPMYGLWGTDLTWSPGGRYLSVNHQAGNQYSIFSIVDAGPAGTADGNVTEINLGRIAQVTSNRFNSFGGYWGTTTADAEILKYRKQLAELFPDEHDKPPESMTSSTLYFLTDRNVVSSTFSPWGSRAPLPNFPFASFLYALPLTTFNDLGRFSGGGTMEVLQDELNALTKQVTELLAEKEAANGDSSAGRQRHLAKVSEKLARALISRGYKGKDGRRLATRLLQTEGGGEAAAATSPYPVDAEIDFGPQDLSFARQAYRLPQVPQAKYDTVLSQTTDGRSLVLIERTDAGSSVIKVFSAGTFPADTLSAATLPLSATPLAAYGISTTRKHVFLMLADGSLKIVPNTLAGLGTAATSQIVDMAGLSIAVWPGLEYKQMFNDAWRLMRDYFYDTNMHNVDWGEMYNRYSSLVKRCTKREELDDVLGQMGAELSALHVFVYGGEYKTPFAGDLQMQAIHTPASLGASLQRNAEFEGYMVTEIPYRDPDFNIVGMGAIYSPVSDQALQLTGQQGLQVGDVIVGINGESAFRTPDIHMLLRGKAGDSVRLEVLRLASSNVTAGSETASESLMVVPILPGNAYNLRLTSWEWKTREKAKELAKEAGFTVGYVHLRSMLRNDMNAFARGFFEDYDKQTFILDVRHNSGGNIDSWISTLLQRKAWSYFGARYQEEEFRVGETDWNQQMSFNGHIIVLINEETASDGEGIARSMSELGLGRLIGKRTWGGGIWLTSSNTLVDGGILSAPEFGTFNEKWGWGTGIEMTGVSPDIEVDNNPRTAYDGVDTQLEAAIAELKQWLEDEPIIEPKSPYPKPDMSLKGELCQFD